MDSQQADLQSRLKNALVALQKARVKIETLEKSQQEPIAIIGMGCRFPAGINTPEQFWQFLLKGGDAIHEVPPTRWNNDHYYDPDMDAPGKISTRWGGFIEQPIDRFDAKFFGISPREARSMDPQQRMLLEVVWETLDHSGYPSTQVAGSQTGVFVGMTMQDYLLAQANLIDPAKVDAYLATGGVFNAAVGRVSYLLGVHGPSIAVDTACSSSLVSVHIAVQSLRSGECDMALAGGVNLILVPEMTVSMTKAHMMAPDGRCKTFDARADGFVRSEGCGMVALKRLSDALADGDRIFAVIRGSAVNHGGSSSGFTVPNKLAQASLVRDALKSANLQPAEVSYIETHGTGTSLGDPIEIRALIDALSEGRMANNPLILGSVKTNFGHLEAGAGIIGLMKLALAAYHAEIPPHLHFETPNPYIPWNDMPMLVPTGRTLWKGTRIGGVSSFGASGTNAHIIVEAAPEQPATSDEAPGRAHLLTISAQTEAALREYAQSYHDFLAGGEAPGLRNLAYTANARRTHLDYRLAVVGASHGELADGLAAYLNGERRVGVSSGYKSIGATNKLAFVFSGQGPQWWAMGRELLEQEPVFREHIETCDALLRQYADWSLVEELTRSEDTSRLDETAIAQPAIFALQVALAALWASWGIKPDAVVGHSVGEIAAAYVAGVLTLEDAVRVVYHRARLMQQATGLGKMMTVDLPLEDAQHLIKPYGERLAVAAINSPTSTVLSGEAEALEAVAKTVGEQGIFHRMLPVNYAFHSPQMEQYKHELARELKGLKPGKARVTIISTVTRGKADGLEYTAEYWGRNIREPVRFGPAIYELLEGGYQTFLEISPHPVLASVMEQCIAAAERPGLVVASLRRYKDERATMLSALGALYSHGNKVEWKALYPKKGQVVSLPTYPWQRERYWVNLPARGQTLPSAESAGSLLGRRLDSPSLQDIVFETQVTPEWPPFLADHRVLGSVLVSGTTYLELASQAAAGVLGTNTFTLTDFLIQEPLILQDGQACTIQVVVKAGETRAVEIYSRADGNWKQHASGTIVSTMNNNPLLPDEMLDAAQARCSQSYDAAAFYELAQENGFDFGATFRGLEQLWLGNNEAVGQVNFQFSDAGSYRFHPGQLDACFHPILILLGDETNQTYLPLSYEAFRVYRTPSERVWSNTRLRDRSADMVVADVYMWDEDGSLIAEVRGLRVKVAADMAKGKTDWLYEVEWKASPMQTRRQSADLAATWLIFADTLGYGEALSTRLEAEGEACLLVEPGEHYAMVRPGCWQIDSENPSDYGRVIEEALRDNMSALSGIVHLWSVNAPQGLASSTQGLSATSALYTAQALINAGLDADFWLVTRGAQAVNGVAANPTQAGVWGLGATLAVEHPNLSIVRVDFDPDAQDDSEALFYEIWQGDGEPQIAFRGGTRYVARLKQSKASSADALLESEQPFILDISERGVFDYLTFRPTTRAKPGAGEIEIRVHATGLNFRDVLNTLGMYPGDAGVLGNECAGEVVAVGEGVEHLKAGDRVMAVAYGTFSRYVTTQAAWAIGIPEHLSYEEAATLPVTFLTAYYALHHLSGMKANDRVLIHAAAGGVGMAAVQLAFRANAEVFGTAGSPAKRKYLATMGVPHLMNSRTLDFADEILEQTHGEGVDIVLNSLAGDFISKSLSSLRAGGSFVEIGKTGIWDVKQAEAVKPGVRYSVLYLGDVCAKEPELIQAMLQEIVRGLEDGSLQPLPLKVFPLREAVHAFRYLAQARHIGKLVLSQDVNPGQLYADATYLITGGTSGIGLHIARWMVEQGARHLALVSRRGMTPEAQSLAEEVGQLGARVVAFSGDISQAEDVERLVGEINANMPPLRGIIHSAGINDDAPVMSQNAERLANVIRPKVDGAQLLSEMTRDLNLDFFVLFSSIAPIIGWFGQSNYAAANACLDAFAHWRRAQGLPTTSINWGIWENTGMTAVLSERDKARWVGQGLNAFSPVEGTNILGHILAKAPSQVVVMPVNWRVFLAERTSPFFEAFARPGAAAPALPKAAPDLLVRLADAPPSKHRSVLTKHIREQAITVLGLDQAHTIDPLLPLNQLGLDSLMAVELRNALALSANLSLPATLLFDYPTIDALVGYLAEKIVLPNQEVTQDTPTEAKPENGASELDGMLDEEVEALLLQELDSLKKKGGR